MNKFKDGFMRGYEDEIAEKKEQEELRAKYDIEDADVVIVEKKQWLKTVITALAGIIRTTAGVALIVLAAIGIIALIYPVPREAVIGVLMELWDSVSGFIS